MSIGLVLTKIMLFCSLVDDQCAIKPIEHNNTVLINTCITSKTNRKYPIIEIGVVDMNNQNNYTIFIIDRNCSKL